MASNASSTSFSSVGGDEEIMAFSSHSLFSKGVTALNESTSSSSFSFFDFPADSLIDEDKPSTLYSPSTCSTIVPTVCSSSLPYSPSSAPSSVYFSPLFPPTGSSSTGSSSTINSDQSLFAYSKQSPFLPSSSSISLGSSSSVQLLPYPTDCVQTSASALGGTRSVLATNSLIPSSSRDNPLGQGNPWPIYEYEDNAKDNKAVAATDSATANRCISPSVSVLFGDLLYNVEDSGHLQDASTPWKHWPVSSTSPLTSSVPWKPPAIFVPNSSPESERQEETPYDLKTSSLIPLLGSSCSSSYSSHFGLPTFVHETSPSLNLAATTELATLQHSSSVTPTNNTSGCIHIGSTVTPTNNTSGCVHIESCCQNTNDANNSTHDISNITTTLGCRASCSTASGCLAHFLDMTMMKPGTMAADTFLSKTNPSFSSAPLGAPLENETRHLEAYVSSPAISASAAAVAVTRSKRVAALDDFQWSSLGCVLASPSLEGAGSSLRSSCCKEEDEELFSFQPFVSESGSERPCNGGGGNHFIGDGRNGDCNRPETTLRTPDLALSASCFPVHSLSKEEVHYSQPILGHCAECAARQERLERFRLSEMLPTYCSRQLSLESSLSVPLASPASSSRHLLEDATLLGTDVEMGGEGGGGWRRRVIRKASGKRNGVAGGVGRSAESLPTDFMGRDGNKRNVDDPRKAQFFKADKCAFAHSANELRPLPNLEKTSICIAWKQGKCERENCKFAHGAKELCATEGFRKTHLCKFFEAGIACPLGWKCRHAHGRAELQPRIHTLLAAELKNGRHQQTPEQPPPSTQLSPTPSRATTAVPSTMTSTTTTPAALTNHATFSSFTPAAPTTSTSLLSSSHSSSTDGRTATTRLLPLTAAILENLLANRRSTADSSDARSPLLPSSFSAKVFSTAVISPSPSNPSSRPMPSPSLSHSSDIVDSSEQHALYKQLSELGLGPEESKVVDASFRSNPFFPKNSLAAFTSSTSSPTTTTTMVRNGSSNNMLSAADAAEASATHTLGGRSSPGGGERGGDLAYGSSSPHHQTILRSLSHIALQRHQEGSSAFCPVLCVETNGSGFQKTDVAEATGETLSIIGKEGKCEQHNWEEAGEGIRRAVTFLSSPEICTSWDNSQTNKNNYTISTTSNHTMSGLNWKNDAWTKVPGLPSNRPPVGGAASEGLMAVLGGGEEGIGVSSIFQKMQLMNSPTFHEKTNKTFSSADLRVSHVPPIASHPFDPFGNSPFSSSASPSPSSSSLPYWTTSPEDSFASASNGLVGSGVSSNSPTSLNGMLAAHPSLLYV